MTISFPNSCDPCLLITRRVTAARKINRRARAVQMRLSVSEMLLIAGVANTFPLGGETKRMSDVRKRLTTWKKFEKRVVPYA